ncbi:MAG: Maf family protein [Deltaproteobacteria bacterium]|jgi:septum formation protein|nr:Maf family protein [Deltaproteobacteria bacterium]
MPLILASASPRRRELLEKVGIAFTVVPATIEEPPLEEDELPEKYVQRVATEKGFSVYDKVSRKKYSTNLVVLAADTAVLFKDLLYGKPLDRDDAKNMLENLSGKTHTVLTGLHFRTPTFMTSSVVKTKVRLRKLNMIELERYLNTSEYEDKAGGYAIQGPYGQTLVDKVEGSFTNVIGLPVTEVMKMLRVLGPDMI